MPKDESQVLNPIVIKTKRTRKPKIPAEKTVKTGTDSGIFNEGVRKKRASCMLDSAQKFRKYKSKVEPKLYQNIVEDEDKSLRELLGEVNDNLLKVRLHKIVKDTHVDELDPSEILRLHDVLNPKEYAKKLVEMKKSKSRKLDETVDMKGLEFISDPSPTEPRGSPTGPHIPSGRFTPISPPLSGVGTPVRRSPFFGSAPSPAPPKSRHSSPTLVARTTQPTSRHASPALAASATPPKSRHTSPTLTAPATPMLAKKAASPPPSKAKASPSLSEALKGGVVGVVESLSAKKVDRARK